MDDPVDIPGFDPKKKYAPNHGGDQLDAKWGPGNQFYRLPEGKSATDVMTYRGIVDEWHPEGIYQDTYGDIAKQQAASIASQQGFNGGTPPTGVTPVGTPLAVQPPGGAAANPAPAQVDDGMMYIGGSKNFDESAGGSIIGSQATGDMQRQIGEANNRVMQQPSQNPGMAASPIASMIAQRGTADLTNAYAAISGQSMQYRAAKAAAKLVANLGVPPSQATATQSTVENQIKDQEAAMSERVLPRQVAASGVKFANSGNSGNGPIQGFTPTAIKSLF